MRTFVRINIISAIYAFVLFIQFQAGVNIYRIVRITDLSFGIIKTLIAIFNFSVFIISTIVFIFITKKYFNMGKLRFLLTFFWMPYYVAFTLICNLLFPIKVRGDEPAPVLGLLLMGAFLIYPFYIAFILVTSSIENKDF